MAKNWTNPEEKFPLEADPSKPFVGMAFKLVDDPYGHANAADLSEKPRLLADDPCRGFYPAGAGVDSAAAVVRVVIEPSGRVREVTLLSEAPAGEGFGAAARQCIRRQRFSAPRDQEGRAVATATTIRVRFDR